MYTSTSSSILLAITIASIPLLLNLPHLITADLPDGDGLKTDKAALLVFYRALPSAGTKLDWDTNKTVCDWVGIYCTNELPEVISIGGGGGGGGDENRVVEVRLPGKGLYGAIAGNSIGNLHALKVLSLRDNILYGKLPSDIFSIPSLKEIYLHRNKFCGDFPEFEHTPPNLEVVDLSFNTISGNIPAVFGRTSSLQYLDLSSNVFSGPVPDFKDNEHLKTLYLANNTLKGQIPSNLIKKIKDIAFDGNPQLCGPPLTRPCGGNSTEPNAAAYCNVLIHHVTLVASSLLLYLLLLW